MGEEMESSAIKNDVKIEDAGPCKKKINIEIPEEAIQSITDEQYENLRKDALVPGFRKGRAPRRLLEKRFGKETASQIKLKLLADASDSAIKDNEINVLREPEIDYEKIELPETGALKFDFEVDVRPEFDLPKLKDIPVNKTKLEVTDKQVQEEITQLQKYSGIWSPREDEKVQLDDQLIADAILKIDGVEEEEKLDNTPIFVRQNGFVGSIPVEKLDKLLIDAKAGDTKKTTIKVPKTYFKEEYRGKKVDVEISIKDVKFLKPAEMNENFFARFGADDEKDLKEKMADTLKARLEQQTQADMSQQIYRYMLDNTNFDLPTDIVAEQADTLLQRQFTNLLQRGLPQEKIQEQMQQLKAGSEAQATEQLKTFFIMDKVAEKLNIEVSQEQINGHIAQLAIQRGQRPEQLRDQMAKDGSLAQFALQVRENLCIEKLLESAKIADVKPKTKEKKTNKKSTKKDYKPVKILTKKTKKKTKMKTDK